MLPEIEKPIRQLSENFPVISAQAEPGDERPEWVRYLVNTPRRTWLGADLRYPSDAEKKLVLDLYLDRFGVNDDFTRKRLQLTLSKDLGRLHLVPAHIEEFVKAGIKRARLARRPPEYQDFEPGIEATKSIATSKPAV